MNHVFTRRLDERPVVVLNHEFQPVSKTNKVVTELSSFIGTIARLYIPLDFVNWSKVPEEEKNGWWEYIKTKYIIPEEGKDWVLKSLDDDWRVYKSRIKRRHYTKYDNDEDRIRNKPATILLEQFKVLMKYWSDEAVQEKAAKNLANRKKLTDTHTAGRTSFAQIRNQMKNVKSACSNTTKTRIYPKTRKGHLKRAKQNGENLEENKEKSDEEQMVEIDLAAHGPNWLVGRSGRTRKMKKTLPKNVNKDSAELTKMREEITAEMEEKMKKKLSKIFAKLGELNPDLNINVEDLCAENSDEVDAEEDEDGDAGSDEDDGSNEVDGDEDAADEDEDGDA